MLDGRLYRAAFIPLLPVLAVVAFSLSSQPAPLTTTLAPDAFDGVNAMQVLQQLVTAYPNRRPGSRGDNELAGYVAQQLAHPAGQTTATTPGVASQQPPFTVHLRRVRAQTIAGSRTLTDVIATRPGAVTGQIVIMAHRDAAARGSAAELSGTAALLELSEVLSGRVTNHSLTFVSTSGGSGGGAGAAAFAANPGGPVDAVIVLGDMAGRYARKPFVLPWSDGQGSAPATLQRTLQNALSIEVGTDPGNASLVSQFAHLAVPFAVGEEGLVNEHGLPAELVQVSGEQGPSPNAHVSAERLQNFGRGVLRAINALDQDPTGPGAPASALFVQGEVLPAWAVRLLVAALLLPVLVAAIDGLARVRRRHEAVGPWVGWVLACAAPFYACALLASILGATGALGGAPGAPVMPDALPDHGSARIWLAVMVLVLVLAWLAWRPAVRGLGVREPPGSSASGIALLLVLDGLAVLLWIFDPFSALLVVPAAHLWQVVASPSLRPRRSWAVVAVLGGLVLPVGVVALYAHELSMGPLQTAWTALLLVAGGHIGLAGALIWSVGLGCTVAAALIALRGREPVAAPEPVTVRGPLTYAGPGSLGGTESALPR